MSIFQKLNKKQNVNMAAFTIIEVVLVLAIAGLIFLMVFIALPALQRNQRDTLRKRHMASFIEAYQRCLANNRGVCSGFPSGSSRSYIPDNEFSDPSTGERYVFAYIGGAANNPSFLAENLQVGQLASDEGAGCNSEGSPVDISPAADPRQRAAINLVIKLENGGLYCVSNYLVGR